MMKTSENETQTIHKIKINRVFDYIEQHLDANLSLESLAAIACLSPFHFHRIFKYVTDETLHEYVTRKRIEKSATTLLHSSKKITEISDHCGFSDVSSFSKSFKKFYGISPTQFKRENPNRFSKIRQINSKNGQPGTNYQDYLSILENLTKWTTMNAKIQIKEMPEMTVGYITCIGPQNIGDAFQRLIRWASPKGLMNDQTKMITIYHDSFKITQADKVRMSACILLHKPVNTSGEVAITKIEAGTFIVGSYEIALDEFEKSWTGLYLWMNENGYKKGERNPFEIFHRNPADHPEKKALVDFFIPID